MNQSGTKVQALFAKTAQVLRTQQAQIRQLRDENTKLAECKSEHDREKRTRELAKKAVDRGIIDGAHESVEDWVKETLASDKSLDVVEQGLEYATGDFFGKEGSDDSDDSTGSGKMDPISSLVLGGDFDFED